MPYSPEDESRLIAAAQDGDKTAFEAIVIQYRHQAVRFARSLVGDAFHAEDIAQECFAKVWLRLPEWKPGGSFKSWLFTIVRNRCIDFLRTRRLESSLEDAGSEWLPTVESGPQESLDRKEAWAAFRIQWRTLAPEARTALYLFAAEGMHYDEIAHVLGKNTPQVKMLLYRTRKRLKQQRERSNGDE